MGALAQFPVVWTPEDDLKLKNSVEGGASLESLAKGAVQFSRRFNLEEIKKRWVSILYDPVISAQVSTRVIEIEHNSSNLSQKSFRPGCMNDNMCDVKKNKTQSIRDHYYAARKRIRYENLRSMEMEFAGGHYCANDHNNGVEPFINTMLGDPTLHQYEQQQSDARLVDRRFPQVKIDGVATSCTGVITQSSNVPQKQFNPESSLAEQGSLPKVNSQKFEMASLSVDCLQSENLGIPEDADMHDANGPAENQHLVFNDVENLFDDFVSFLPDSAVSLESLDFPSSIPDMSFWDINDDPDPIMPVIDDPASQSYNAGDILTLQEGGQSFMHDNEAGPANSLNQVGGPTNSGSEEYLAEIYDLLGDEVPVTDTDNKPTPVVVDGDLQTVSASKLSYVPQSTANTSNLVESHVSGASHAVECQAFPAQNDSVACILNTEDPVVPNNDGIVLPHISSSVKDLLDSRNHCEPASNLFRKDHENLGKQEFRSKAQIGQLAPEKSLNHASVDCKAPNNLPEAGTHVSLRSTSLLPNLTKEAHSELVISRGSDHCGNTVACPSNTNELCRKSDNILGETHDDQALNQRVECDDPSMRESLAQRPLSKFEDHEYESDDEIPYYSDIEEMVLEMDLDPVEQHVELDKVSKYQSSDARKTIIRLEQAAHSFMQRAIARRGALAVIYGRNSKHYIKKSEVLLGRGTDDSQVDIDLGAEGRAHRVSRRQAVIRLEADGNFYIKNIGKWSIYKNNLELATGKTTRLQSGSLIEIQRLTFIFEDSPVCVRRHLRNLQTLPNP